MHAVEEEHVAGKEHEERVVDVHAVVEWHVVGNGCEGRVVVRRDA